MPKVANAIPAQGRGMAVIIKRPAAVGEERSGHAGSVALEGFYVQRRIFYWGDRVGLLMVLLAWLLSPEEKVTCSLIVPV